MRNAQKASGHNDQHGMKPHNVTAYRKMLGAKLFFMMTPWASHSDQMFEVPHMSKSPRLLRRLPHTLEDNVAFLVNMLVFDMYIHI